MTDQDAVERAQSLCVEARAAIDAADIPKARDLARQALHIDHESSAAKVILTELVNSVAPNSPVPRHVSRYVESRDDAEGQAALVHLTQQMQLSDEQGRNSIQLLLRRCKVYTETDDRLTATILTASEGARKFVSDRFDQHPTETFRLFWHRGERSYAQLIAIITLADPNRTEAICHKSIRGAFQLALSHVIDAGEDHVARALTTVARLLSTHSDCLMDLLDYDTFDFVLPCLHVRESETTTTQALLVTIALLKVSKEAGERHLQSFIIEKVNRQHQDDLTMAFSVAAAVFPVVPSAISSMLLLQGFIPSLMPLLQRRNYNERCTQVLESAALKMFSAACQDKTCREAIASHCTDWLRGIAGSDLCPSNAADAALVLTKFGSQDSAKSSSQPSTDSLDLAQKLIRLLVDTPDNNAAAQQSAIEGLAYSTLAPAVKELFVNGSSATSRLVQVLRNVTIDKAAVYGALTAFDNVTKYRPIQSEEQRKMSQLRDYANSRKPAYDDDLLDADDKVRARCKAVLQAGLVAAIADKRLDESPTVQALVAQIIHSLSREQEHRGQLAQQGAVKRLLHIYAKDLGSGSSGASISSAGRICSHALARILITVNPNHVFSSSIPAVSALRPLLGLITRDDSADGSLLPMFEALLALTNLASVPEDNIREVVIQAAWPTIEDLLLNNNTMIQRAAAELVCNLMASPFCVAKYADTDTHAATRMRVLLALSDVEDVATRKAAGGALAMLTEWDAAAMVLLRDDRAIKLLLGMCEDDDDEMKHRGFVCLTNVVSAPGSTGSQGAQAIRAHGGQKVVGGAIQRASRSDIRRLGLDLLRRLG